MRLTYQHIYYMDKWSFRWDQAAISSHFWVGFKLFSWRRWPAAIIISLHPWVNKLLQFDEIWYCNKVLIDNWTLFFLNTNMKSELLFQHPCRISVNKCWIILSRSFEWNIPCGRPCHQFIYIYNRCRSYRFRRLELAWHQVWLQIG